MPDERQVDEPVPTIVGPRPEGGPGGKVSVPQGIERLLTLAGSNAAWKEKVLADPVAAAISAKIRLSENERAILRATPKRALADVIKSFEKKHGMSTAGKVVVGVAVGVAATGLGVGYLGLMCTTTGIRPDAPPTRPVQPEAPGNAPTARRLDSLDVALAQAKQESRAVMAVFLHPRPIPPLGSPERGKITAEQKSQRTVLAGSRESQEAVSNANLIVAKVAEPAPPFDLATRGGATEAEQKLVDKYKESLAAYEAALKKYGLDEKNLPAVMFLAPDGSGLSKLVRPEEEAKLIEAIQAIPPLMAKWLNDQSKDRRPAPTQWSWGHRP